MDTYWKYTMFTLMTILGFEASTAFQRLKSMSQLRNMSAKAYDVWVYRRNRWVGGVAITELLPGDIISLTPLQLTPAQVAQRTQQARDGLLERSTSATSSSSTELEKKEEAPKGGVSQSSDITVGVVLFAAYNFLSIVWLIDGTLRTRNFGQCKGWRNFCVCTTSDSERVDLMGDSVGRRNRPPPSSAVEHGVQVFRHDRFVDLVVLDFGAVLFEFFQLLRRYRSERVHFVREKLLVCRMLMRELLCVRTPSPDTHQFQTAPKRTFSV